MQKEQLVVDIWCVKCGAFSWAPEEERSSDRVFGVCWDKDSVEQTGHLGRENIRDCVQCTVYRSPFFSIYPIKLTGNECSSVSEGNSLKPFLFSSHQTFIRPSWLHWLAEKVRKQLCKYKLDFQGPNPLVLMWEFFNKIMVKFHRSILFFLFSQCSWGCAETSNSPLLLSKSGMNLESG